MNPAPSLSDILVRPDVWRGRLADAAMPALPSGFAALDAELPGGGWPRGALTELLADAEGIGECALLRRVFEAMREEGRWSVLIAPPYGLHAPAWAAGGADCARLAVVTPPSRRDFFWAVEQALASGAAGVVACWAAQADPAQMRRLQVAVAGRATLAFVFRPARARAEASAAPLRLLLSSGPRGTLAVDVLKRRGPPLARTLFLDVPRPVVGRDDHDADASALAGAASAPACAGGRRPVAVA